MRLVCLCWATFFMVHMAVAIVARLSAGTAVRLAEHMKPSSAARLLFAIRVSPLVLTLVSVLALCVPSYLWLEPEATGEHVGLLCMLAAALGVVLWVPSLIRVMAALRGTARFLDRCERHGRKINVPGELSPALLLAEETPLLAVAGVLRPQLVISRPLMRGLSVEEREAALRHERAHCAAGDNLKRFLILLAPDVLPFVHSFGKLERGWAKFTEWSADDQATAGDPQRALSLAGALVRVAKMGSKPRLGYLSCSLLGSDQELSERVDRLLRPQPKPGKPVREVVSILTSVGALAGSAVAVLLLWPSSLSLVHRALEQLIH
jgi:hypothetical protein